MFNNQLPMVPGMRIDTTMDKGAFHKSHKFDINNGVHLADLKHGDPRGDKRKGKAQANSAHNLLAGQYGEDDGEVPWVKKSGKLANTLNRLPAWVAYDKKVLKFFGFFEQKVLSSPTENYRVRKVELLYFLDDQSVEIKEPKQENSGLVQGVHLRRHKVRDITLDDLCVGHVISLYSIKYKLTDCDQFTREFMAQSGRPQPEAEEIPLDSVAQKHYQPHGQTYNRQKNDMKNYMEARLGKPVLNEKSTAEARAKAGKVLRFYMLWDDQSILGEKKPYILHYFLEDDTVEVNEVNAPNNGKDPHFSSLLKRGKLPYNFRATTSSMANIGVADPNTRYYHHSDFKIGTTIHVYARPLVVQGMDGFTKQFMCQKYGLDPRTIEDRHLQFPPSPRATILKAPEHTGIGTEEDSIASFLSLHPQLPQPNWAKLKKYANKTLRFQATLYNPSPEDEERKFVVIYHLDIDKISVVETIERNSGFAGGKFMEKNKFKNPATGTYFTPTDLQEGQVVNVNSWLFHLERLDPSTAPEYAEVNGQPTQEQKADSEGFVKFDEQNLQQQ